MAGSREGEAVREAAAHMEAFAERTGLDSERPPRRYLWTDAFAVCNLLALARATGQARYRSLALGLVEQVHHVLGRHRRDAERAGWISGLDEAEGERHPTRGGLRIGKPLPERPRGASFDDRLEWERDGQYFHYLTKWMHALDQVARATGEARFNAWARELADAAHRAFTYRPGGPGARLRMVWKMSVDLSRPLVPSMGQHDPLDGLVTCVQLRATAAQLEAASAGPDLEDAVSDFADLARGGGFATADPLGLGGLLTDACRVAQITAEDAVAFEGSGLLDALLAAALEGLAVYARGGDWRGAPERRLAFRELGLAIGLAALPEIARVLRERGDRFADAERLLARTGALGAHRELGTAIGAFWRRPEHRETRLWREHRDIDEVMLATWLAPEGALILRPVQVGRRYR